MLSRGAAAERAAHGDVVAPGQPVAHDSTDSYSRTYGDGHANYRANRHPSTDYRANRHPSTDYRANRHPRTNCRADCHA